MRSNEPAFAFTAPKFADLTDNVLFGDVSP